MKLRIVFAIVIVAAAVLLGGFQANQNNFSGGGCSGTWFSTGGVTISVASPATGATKVWGFSPSCSFSATTVAYTVATADNTTNTYDLGIYDVNGNLLAHIGSTAGTSFAPSTGGKNLTWTGGTTVNFAAGSNYYLAWTTNCASSCAALDGSSQGSFIIGGAGPAPSSGNLVTGSMPANAWQGGNFPGVVLHN